MLTVLSQLMYRAKKDGKTLNSYATSLFDRVLTYR
jgi:hypothetical protein